MVAAMAMGAVFVMISKLVIVANTAVRVTWEKIASRSVFPK